MIVAFDLLQTICPESSSIRKVLPVGSCIFHIVLDVDVLEAFADGSCGLVSGQDSLASHADPLGSLNKFLFEMVLA